MPRRARSPSNESDGQPDRKRRRLSETSAPSSTKVKSQPLLLWKGFEHSPNDIFTNILSYVGWEDLVSLAHTNLFFRLYLTDPRSNNVWESARHAYDDFLIKIPDPPVGIPEYVLAFFILRPTCCVKCDSHQDIVKEYMQWYCRNCQRSLYGSRADIKSEFPNLPSSYFTPQIMPTITDGDSLLFSIPYAMQLSENYREDVEEESDIRHRHAMISSYTTACDLYISTSDELKHRKHRYQTILSYLADFDYTDLAVSLGKRFTRHPLVSNARVMDDLEWGIVQDDILQILIDYENELRRPAIARVVREVHRNCMAVLSLDDSIRAALGSEDWCIPNPDEMCELPEFREVIDKIPFREQPTVEMFRDAFENFPVIFARWLHRRHDALLCMVREHHPEATLHSLGLARTVFQCKLCLEPVWYPHVLVHWCDMMWTSPSCTLSPEETGGAYPWRNPIERFRLFPGAEEVARNVVQSCGDHSKQDIHIHPDTARIRQLNRLPVLFVCRTCEISHPECSNVMTWKDAIHHGAALPQYEVGRFSESEYAHPRPHLWATESTFYCIPERLLGDEPSGLRCHRLQQDQRGCNTVCTWCCELFETTRIRRHIVGKHGTEMYKEHLTIIPDMRRPRKYFTKVPDDIELLDSTRFLQGY